MRSAASPNLKIDGAMHVCVACDAELGLSSENYKVHAVCREVPLAAVGGAYANGFDGDVVLRHFYCPACARLLDTETARGGEPCFADRVDR